MRWRWYWDFGGGILTDLLTHWIDVIQWYMDQPAPKTATTVGDLYAHGLAVPRHASPRSTNIRAISWSPSPAPSTAAWMTAA